MTHLNPQALLLLVLLTVIPECRGVSPVTETVFASPEEDVVLPCFQVMDPKSCFRVRLIKYASDARQMTVILARPKTPKFQDAERVKWESDGNGKMSLLLTKSQKSDEGQYRCETWQGWDCILVKNISLKVKDCRTLTVKAEPSTPVNLKCPVDKVTRHQNISWERLEGGNPVSVTYERVEIKRTSMAIQSVSYSDSGWYRCKYLLGQTRRCFDINLLVREVETVTVATTVPGLTTTETMWKEGSGGALTTVVVASVITVIAIMATLVGLFICHMRNIQRVTQQTQRRTAGTLGGSYETVNFTEDCTNQRVNSIYHQSPDETLYTFHY